MAPERSRGCAPTRSNGGRARPGATAELDVAERRPAGVRGRLLLAAREVVASAGYGRATVSELCRVAGLSRQTFYAHFADLEACVAAAFEAHLESLPGLLDPPAGSRARLLRAITERVGERGYSATSLSEVLAVAGVSHREFYSLYADKLECFGAAHAAIITGLEGRLGEARRGCDTPAERLAASLGELAACLAREPQSARVVVLEAAVLADRAAPERRSAPARSLAGLLDGCLRACADTELDPAARQMAIGSLMEVLRREVAAGRWDALAGRVAELVFVALLPILGPESTLRETRRVRDRLA